MSAIPIGARCKNAIGLVVFMGWLLFGCSSGNSDAVSDAERGLAIVQSTIAATKFEIEYRIDGTTTKASLTYENEYGNTEQRDVDVPWQLSMRVRRSEFLYISAQNLKSWGTIECTILQNGKIIAWAESQGAYKIATCDASAGDRELYVPSKTPKPTKTRVMARGTFTPTPVPPTRTVRPRATLYPTFTPRPTSTPRPAATATHAP